MVTAQDVDNTTLLEGLVIAGGNSHDGAGIQLIRSDIVVAQCTIQENRAGRLSGDGLEQETAKILEARRPFYQEMADCTIDTSCKNIEAIADEILGALGPRLLDQERSRAI